MENKVLIKKKRELIDSYIKYAPAIYRYFFYRLNSAELAEDFVQEVFLRVWKYDLKGESVKNIRPFLYRTAHNLIVDHYRKKRPKKISIEDAMLTNSKIIFAISKTEMPDIETKELIEEVNMVMKCLPEEYQKLLKMRYLDGYKPREIARFLDKKPKNISAKIKRAEKKLDHMILLYDDFKKNKIKHKELSNLFKRGD